MTLPSSLLCIYDEVYSSGFLEPLNQPRLASNYRTEAIDWNTDSITRESSPRPFYSILVDLPLGARLQAYLSDSGFTPSANTLISIARDCHSHDFLEVGTAVSDLDICSALHEMAFQSSVAFELDFSEKLFLPYLERFPTFYRMIRNSCSKWLCKWLEDAPVQVLTSSVTEQYQISTVSENFPRDTWKTTRCWHEINNFNQLLTQHLPEARFWGWLDGRPDSKPLFSVMDLLLQYSLS